MFNMERSEESKGDGQETREGTTQIGGAGNKEAENLSVASSKNPRNASNQSKKRGMKPRSKRNRKRARSKLDVEEQNYETSVCRLEINGKPVNSSAGWLRTVEPYPYTFSTFAKARWVGRTLLEVYNTEFGSYPKVSTCVRARNPCFPEFSCFLNRELHF